MKEGQSVAAAGDRESEVEGQGLGKVSAGVRT